MKKPACMVGSENNFLNPKTWEAGMRRTEPEIRFNVSLSCVETLIFYLLSMAAADLNKW